MFSFLRRVIDIPRFLPPAMDAVPDMTGNSLWGGTISDSFINVHLANNTELPRRGDVVARLVSCGMGMSVRRDERYRVIGGPTQKGDSKAVLARALDGSEEWIHPHALRRHARIRGFWFWYD